MLEVYNPDKQKVPVRAWLESKGDLDQVCLKQAINLSNLPFIYKWVALMPDTHPGYGMPIGGVAAMIDHIVPNAVGVDIGCGMIFAGTSIPAKALDDQTAKLLIQRIMGAVPLGFKHHSEPVAPGLIQTWLGDQQEAYARNHILMSELEKAQVQLGTLGGGNHFIELQEDDRGMLGIMIHSGSRHFGLEVAKYYNEKAKRYCKKHGEKHAVAAQLPYLPVSSEAGQDYLRWMQLAQRFAAENRRVMMEIVQDILREVFPSIAYNSVINAHHNYAALEEHFGQKVWVHRKGAIRAGKGELGIIPGAMGAYSYIVKGKGNPNSFCSCSHGAGRHMSRKEAIKAFKRDDVLRDLATKGIHIGVPGKSLVVDESRFAYKDINQVMKQQEDLAEVVRSLTTRLVIKG